MCPGTFLTDPGCAGDGLSHAPALPAVSNVFASVSAEPSTPSSFCGTHLGRSPGNKWSRGLPG